MSDRRPSKLYVKGTLMGFKDNTDIGVQFREATPAEALAAVRRGVESGEVEGVKREWYCERQKRCVDTDGYQCRIGYNEAEAHPECGWHILIPASTAGEDL